MYSVIHKIYPGEIKYQKGRRSPKNCSLRSAEPMGKGAQSSVATSGQYKYKPRSSVRNQASQIKKNTSYNHVSVHDTL